MNRLRASLKYSFILTVASGLLMIPLIGAGAAAAGGSWAATGPIPVPIVADHVAAVLKDGKVLVAGGRGSNGSNAAAALFDPATGKWTAAGTMAAGREEATATTLPDGRVLVAGGVQTGASGLNYLASAEIFDPATGKWSVTGPMAKGRAAYSAALLKTGKVLVAGGISGGHDPLITSAELYDPATGSWSSTAAMPNGRAETPAVTLTDGTVLIAGGRGPAHSASLQDILIYDPAAGTWAPAPHQLGEIRGLHTATLMKDGKVLIAGGTKLFSGNRLSDVLKSVEIYDPAAKTLTPASPMSQPRYYHTATALANGDVLVAGGYGSNAGKELAVDPLASAELFNPATGKWSPAGSLKTPAGLPNTVARPTATLLGPTGCGSNCGKVLLVGGGTTASLYSPAPAGGPAPAEAGAKTKASSKLTPVVIAGVAAGIVVVVAITWAARRKR